MAEEPESIVLVYLRRIDAKLDRMADDFHDVKVRLTNLEEGQAGLNRRIDRLEERMERIEHRLDLVDLPH